MEINEKAKQELFKESLKMAIRCNFNLLEGQNQDMCNNIDEAAKFADFCLDMINETDRSGKYRNR